MSRMEARLLPDRRRLHLHDGPIDLIIGAEGGGDARALAFAAARGRFATILDELCAELPLLRRPTAEMPVGTVARRMWRATRGHARSGFITPMAAVAGAIAEEILAAMAAAAELHRAFVNNGGDIALHLAPGTSYRIGLVDRPDRPSLFAEASLAAAHQLRGIATSGWRGRSFSLGIADAVTVLAAGAADADAAATIIANAVDLPGHGAITRLSARALQPDSDLGDRPVTRDVGPLTDGEVAAALANGAAAASSLLAAGTIAACALHLAGRTRLVGALPMGAERRLAANG